jgi:hypothetical protein
MTGKQWGSSPHMGTQNNRTKGVREMTVKIHSVILVCQDCLHVLANGECGERPADLPEPLAIWKDDHSVHLSPDAVEHGYMTRACQGCGDWRHGDRYSVTVFYRYTWDCVGPGMWRYGMYLAARRYVRGDRQWLVKSGGEILGTFPLLADAKEDIETRVRKG